MATVFVVARIRAGPCPPDVIARLLQTTHATRFDLSRQEATQKIKRQEDATDAARDACGPGERFNILR